NGRYLLEYPPGKVLYSTTSWFNNVRISPNGDFVAFMDHPQGGDDRGTVAFVDLKGNVKQLTSDYASESGLHWSPDGTEIWYTASIEGSNEQTLYAVNLQGKIRTIAAMVGNLILHDIRPGGSMLLARDSRRRETIALPPGETREKDFSWFDWTYCREISDDGKTLVFEEQGAGGGPNYSVYIRNMDGSPAVKLGDGYATGVSHDGKFVISHLPGDYSGFTILPTGAGQPKPVSNIGIQVDFQRMQIFKDNRHMIFLGHEKGHLPRF